MGDHGSLPSPTDKTRRPTASIFGSPRLFTGFSPKGFFTDADSVPSPTSILDPKTFSPLRNPFWSDPQTRKSPKLETKTPWDNPESRGVGLCSIVDELVDEIADPKQSNPKSRKVLFGSQLRIQIPPPRKSPADFGIKTRNCQLVSPGRRCPLGSAGSGRENPNSPRLFTGSLSQTEMELSEDYTCVISHGPNPKTIHIFDDCVVDLQSCYGVGGFSATGTREEKGLRSSRSMSYPSESFLSFCHTCKKNLGQGKDIYIYRGEKAFCSSECRCKEMMLEEVTGKMESDI
ncbi:hypothetical protein NMG60_11029941 [Bertholletia excelsa]